MDWNKEKGFLHVTEEGKLGEVPNVQKADREIFASKVMHSAEYQDTVHEAAREWFSDAVHFLRASLEYFNKPRAYKNHLDDVISKHKPDAAFEIIRGYQKKLGGVATVLEEMLLQARQEIDAKIPKKKDLLQRGLRGNLKEYESMLRDGVKDLESLTEAALERLAKKRLPEKTKGTYVDADGAVRYASGIRWAGKKNSLMSEEEMREKHMRDDLHGSFGAPYDDEDIPQ